MNKRTVTIDRGRCTRMGVGLHDERNPSRQNWFEMGHWYEGLQIKLTPVNEPDGYGRKAPSIGGYVPLGYLVSGTGRPAQNNDEAQDYYRNALNGTRNFFFLMGKNLLILRFVSLGGRNWEDHRISVSTGYDYTLKLAGDSEFSGWIPDYELIPIDPNSLKINGGALSFTPTVTPSPLWKTIEPPGK